jgi:hypothetical protein
MQLNQILIFWMVGGDGVRLFLFFSNLAQGEAEKVPLICKGYFQNASP